MKNMKKVIAVVVMAGILGTAGMAFAAEARTPADIVSDLTGKTMEQVSTDREEGTRYGVQASKAGKIEEFQDAMLERMKNILDEYVKEGTITQKEADERLKTMEENMKNCDGTGTGMMGGNRSGLGLGQGRGNGQGLGRGIRGGCRMGSGTGIGAKAQ